MRARDMCDEGVANLLTAFTISAYDDYVNGGILLQRAEFETTNGVIKLLTVNGRKPKPREESLVKYYIWSKKYFDGAKYGEWLIRKGNEEIRAGHHRGLNRSKILQDRKVKDAMNYLATHKGKNDISTRLAEKDDFYAKCRKKYFGDL